MSEKTYRSQVELLVKVLPFVAKESVFALKGGTAINLFVRDFPRLSVDIDLTYLPFDERSLALKNIADALGQIKNDIEQSIPGIRVTALPQSAGNDARLLCNLHGTQIKIEANTTMRGQLFPTRTMALSDKVQEKFESFAEISVVSNGELYGGKICAALDRQHPRDIFDAYHLLEDEGITEEIKIGFIACLLSHPRPINEVLIPNLIDQKDAYDRQFSGMAFLPFSYEDFEKTRIRLVKEINKSLTKSDKDFLSSFKNGSPQWDLIDAPNLKDMPAVKWKLLNIQKLIAGDKEKHGLLLKALQEKLV